MPVEGLPTADRIIFWSNDEVYLLRTQVITRKGQRMLLCYMLLTEQVMRRYDIESRDLDYRLDSRGVFIKEYPEEYFQRLPEHPENRTIIAFCNFDGTMTIDSDMGLLRDQMKRKNQTIADLQTENDSLRIRNRSLAQRLRSLKIEGLE